MIKFPCATLANSLFMNWDSHCATGQNFSLAEGFLWLVEKWIAVLLARQYGNFNKTMSFWRERNCVKIPHLLFYGRISLQIHFWAFHMFIHAQQFWFTFHNDDLLCDVSLDVMDFTCIQWNSVVEVSVCKYSKIPIKTLLKTVQKWS